MALILNHFSLFLQLTLSNFVGSLIDRLTSRSLSGISPGVPPTLLWFVRKLEKRGGENVFPNNVTHEDTEIEITEKQYKIRRYNK